MRTLQEGSSRCDTQNDRQRTARLPLIALFGPTSAGKTGIAIELAAILRERGEDPIAVNCDSIQAYQGLEVLSGAASPAERERLEHRMLAFVPPAEELSAGRFATLARAEIAGLLEAGRRVFAVGGTGLWLMAALTDMELRPPVDPLIRRQVERRIEREGARSLHAELPVEIRARMEPQDRQRIGRAHELIAAGHRPWTRSEGIWAAPDSQPTIWFAITASRDELRQRIEHRVRASAACGRQEARRLIAGDPSRTAAAAIGVREYSDGDLEAVVAKHLSYAKRQKTWMRRLERANVIDRTGMSDHDVARTALTMIDGIESEAS